DDVRPDAASVLAHAPPLILVVTVTQREVELALRLLARLRGGRREHAEVLADDLVRRVPLESRSARVPGDHVTLYVEHEDRVVGDVVDERAEPPSVAGGRTRIRVPALSLGGRCHR